MKNPLGIMPGTNKDERKLYAIFDKRWKGFRAEFGDKERKNWQSSLNIKSSWEKYIFELGMKRPDNKELNPVGTHIPEERIKHRDENCLYVFDPAYPLESKYIIVSSELALKILTLGELP